MGFIGEGVMILSGFIFGISDNSNNSRLSINICLLNKINNPQLMGLWEEFFY